MPPSSASSSAQSLISMQMKSVKPGVLLGLEPTNKKVAQMLKNVQVESSGHFFLQTLCFSCTQMEQLRHNKLLMLSRKWIRVWVLLFCCFSEQPDEIDDFQDAIETFEGVEEADFETG